MNTRLRLKTIKSCSTSLLGYIDAPHQWRGCFPEEIFLGKLAWEMKRYEHGHYFHILQMPLSLWQVRVNRETSWGQTGVFQLCLHSVHAMNFKAITHAGWTMRMERTVYDGCDPNSHRPKWKSAACNIWPMDLKNTSKQALIFRYVV